MSIGIEVKEFLLNFMLALGLELEQTIDHVAFKLAKKCLKILIH